MSNLYLPLSTKYNSSNLYLPLSTSYSQVTCTYPQLPSTFEVLGTYPKYKLLYLVKYIQVQSQVLFLKIFIMVQGAFLPQGFLSCAKNSLPLDEKLIFLLRLLVNFWISLFQFCYLGCWCSLATFYDCLTPVLVFSITLGQN